MDRVYTIEEIKSIVAPIAAAHNVGRIYLFGSYARGEATPSSDIDLRVDKGRLRGLFALGALYADLEDGLGKKLDLLTAGSLDQKFLQHISNEEVLIYASNDRDLQILSKIVGYCNDIEHAHKE
jgi:predicted nucleotidyltransferase